MSFQTATDFITSEAMYRLIVQNMMDMVRIVNIHGECVYASPSHEKTLGYKPEHYIQEQLFLQTIHPNDVGAVNVAFQQLLTTKKPLNLQFRLINAHGQTIYVDERSTPVLREDGEIDHILFVSRDVTDKILTERALTQSEHKYRSITENMTDMVGVFDLGGIIRYASPSYKKVLGLDADTLVGTSASDYVHSEDVAYIWKKFSQLIRTKQQGQERVRYIHADGRFVHVDCLGTPIFNEDGEIESVVIVARDITEQVRMEKELTDSEERYRRLIELSPHAMLSHRDEVFIYANPAAVQLLGATNVDQLVGKGIYDIFHPDYASLARKRATAVIDKKYVSSLEYKVLRLDGQVIEAEGTGIYDQQNQSTLSVFNDITERKKMERALLESEERYRRLVELSPVAIGLCSYNKFVFVNPAAMDVLGANSEDEVKGTAVLDWVHPDDFEDVKYRIENSVRDGNGCKVECKIIRLDGQVVDISATAIYDTESSTIQLMFEDITARKQAEQDLLESEELNRLLIELSPQAIAFHSDYEYLLVNPASVSMFRALSSSELIGRSIFDIIHPDYHAETKSRLAEVYMKKRTDTPAMEQKLVRLDGSVIDIEVIATPIPYKGKTAGLTLIRDITERKKAEQHRKLAVQTIRESEDRYFRLQTSLDRFSHDLFGVMQVSDMERRLVQEVRVELGTSQVSLIEVNRNHEVLVKAGDQELQKSLVDEMLVSTLKNVTLCEINTTSHGWFLKIGELKGSMYVLCISGKPQSLQLSPKRVWLKTITRYVSVLYDSFRVIADLTKELEQTASQQVAPSWLLRLLFNLSENERKRLSQDLHDAALQEQIIWYRKLDQLSNDSSIPAQVQEQLRLITQGMLDVIYQIRITCNELRPPMLREEGIVSSLAALFEFTQIRTDYSIQFDAAGFHQTLNDNQLLSIYRIVQELLANATKHSKATLVKINLSSASDRIELHYEDNGIGMDVSAVSAQSYNRMGVYGMKERVRSMDGTMDIHSLPNQGLAVFIAIPAQ